MVGLQGVPNQGGAVHPGANELGSKCGVDAEQILEQRAAVLRAAFEAHPQRFEGRVPSPGMLPEAVWINPPEATP